MLVHGLGLDHCMWKKQISALKENFHVISYDLLGHGKSQKRKNSYSLKKFEVQLLGLVSNLNLGKFALVGFSLGGMVARTFAVSYPELVSALVVLNSPHDRSKEERDGVMLRVRQAENGGPKATVEAAIERWFTEKFRLCEKGILEQVRQWIMSNDPKIYAKI